MKDDEVLRPNFLNRLNVFKKPLEKGHTAEVTSLLDYLRDKSEGRKALVKALQRPATKEDLRNPSNVADWLLEALWLEGCIVVPAPTPEDQDDG